MLVRSPGVLPISLLTQVQVAFFPYAAHELGECVKLAIDLRTANDAHSFVRFLIRTLRFLRYREYVDELLSLISPSDTRLSMPDVEMWGTNRDEEKYDAQGGMAKRREWNIA